jgi:nitrogen fixation NifU-like protein
MEESRSRPGERPRGGPGERPRGGPGEGPRGDLDELYQEVILDHNRRPRNFRALDGGRKAEGYNPLCGDRLTVYLRVDDDNVIRDATFEGSGCAISKASASLMTDSVKGKTVAEAEALFERFHRAVTASPDAPVEDLGKLSALTGVRQFPVRVKCATLAWYALRAAAEAQDEVVSTE